MTSPRRARSAAQKKTEEETAPEPTAEAEKVDGEGKFDKKNNFSNIKFDLSFDFLKLRFMIIRGLEN